MQNKQRQRQYEEKDRSLFNETFHACKELLELHTLLKGERVMALLMGLHPRLGANSYVGRLDSELLSMIIHTMAVKTP